MAVLDAVNRLRTLSRFLQDASPPGGCTKADIRAAVDAADDWVDANASAFNLALPVTFRTAATAAQKNVLIAYVCLRRAGLLKAQGD